MIEKIKYYITSNHFSEIILKVSILLITIIYFLGNLYSPAFSTDTWSNFEISKNIFSDFNKINTFRQFQINEPYNISFPPLYPILINIFNLFFNSGIYAGYFINFIILFFTTIIIRAICFELLKSKIIGYLIVFFLISTGGYWLSLSNGTSMPLSILIFYISFYFCIKVSNPFYIMIIIGGLCGLMFLNRFDTLLASFLLGISLSILFRKENNLFLLLTTFLVSFSLINSFYFFDNYEKFGKIFISDNSRTVMAAEATYYSDYFSSDIDTFIQRPKDWIIKTARNVLKSLKGLYRINIFLPMITFMLTYFYFSIFNKNYSPLRLNKDQKLAFCFFIFNIFQILSISLTGYSDQRYFIHFLIYSFLFLQIIFHNQNKNAFKKISKNLFGFKHVIILFIVINIFLQDVTLRPSIRSIIKYPIKLNDSFFHIDNNQIELKTILSEDVNSKVLWMWGNKYVDEQIKIKTTNRAIFGALTGLTVLGMPNNLNKNNLNQFFREYKPTHIFFIAMTNNTRYAELFKHISNNFDLTKLSENVYKINQFAKKI